MTDYQIGRDIEKLEKKVEMIEGMLGEIYSLVKFNFDKGVLKEPVESKDKE
jgi:hypothetical protein